MVMLLGASLPSLAQSDFRATATTVAMAEGGTDNVLLVETDNERFSISIPRGYVSQANAGMRSITFTANTGDSVITMRFTTNYAGSLPKEETLRDTVAGNHGTASLVGTASSRTDLGALETFDLFQPAANGLIVRLRDAFVAYPEGSVEFMFSCNNTDFDKQKLGFSRLVYSFRMLPKDAKNNP